MTITATTHPSDRFRIHRAGVLNVWQYDDQVFDFCDGRLLLRGANGAGKSKTMEMLLPFAIDGDKSRLTASGRHHTSLLWLLLDGYDGGARTGYLWVEFTRPAADGTVQTLTCGVGLRATASAKQATAWFFTTTRRIGVDLQLEDANGPLSQPALIARLEGDGQVFDQARRYRAHVGDRLFGLPLEQYEELLRLLYWLRQPQVGEDIDPRRLAEQLVQALPAVDPDALREAGGTFDELEAFGETIERRARAAAALTDFVLVYGGYARRVLLERGQATLDASAAVTRARRAARVTTGELQERAAHLQAARTARDGAVADARGAAVRIRTLEASPEARSRQRLLDLGRAVQRASDEKDQAQRLLEQADARATSSAREATVGQDEIYAASQHLHRLTDNAGQAVGRTIGRLSTEAAVTPTAALMLPPPTWEQDGASNEAAERTRHAVDAHEAWATSAASLVTQVGATLDLIEQARLRAESARTAADQAQRAVDAAEERLEQDRTALDNARAASQGRADALAGALARWLELPGAPGSPAAPDLPLLDLPELTTDGLTSLESMARQAVEPRRQQLADLMGAARAQIETVDAGIIGLAERRRRIEAEVDPAPPAPSWQRDDRSARPGAALWQLVDWSTDPARQLPDEQRAGLEAALEGAGLLDAWVEPDGRVSDADRYDVTLLAAELTPRDGEPPSRGQHQAPVSLADLLQADPPAGCPVPAGVVESVLHTIGIGPPAGDPRESRQSPDALAVDVQGRWWFGSLSGRTTKATAQYLGATARAAEKARRLSELDLALAAATQQRQEWKDAAAAHADTLAEIAGWLAGRPRHEPVLAAWSAESASDQAAQRSSKAHADAVAMAERQRTEAATHHTELVRLGDRHGQPITAPELAARRTELRHVGDDLRSTRRHGEELRALLTRWLGIAQRARDDAVSLTDRTVDAGAATARLAEVGAEHEELSAIQGEGIQQLEQRLAEQRTAEQAASRRAEQLDTEIIDLTRTIGGLEQRVSEEESTLAAAEPRRDAAFEALRQLYDVAGLVESAFSVDISSGGDAGQEAPRQEAPREEVTAPTDVTQVRHLVGRAGAGRQHDVNDVLAAMNTLQNSPAALNEPRLVSVHEVYAAVGRDDTGERSAPGLAARLTAAVAADRDLLSQRERELFENHVLGQLGDALRGVRRQAEELVAAMNDQLKTVSTSQGIRVRLRWRLRDDIPTDARRAVQLLGQPLGALLPDERVELRKALHRLIEVAKAEAPEQSYAEHLGRALDYRQWNVFTVQYHRPETGDWRDLQRRSALSQGEQKVLCYLPLFAAASAHFTSLAGAAPHAPRFILLDDAFPKIDVRTHPLLFGLLVDLDLDFVVTSERLWGTHATVPSLAIYEALRNPAQRGIAQYQHRWDGRQLTAVGA